MGRTESLLCRSNGEIKCLGIPGGCSTALKRSNSYKRGGSAYGIRTRDLRLERAVSLAARRTRHVIYVKKGVAGDRGFEPRLTEPESVVLPLDESPVCPNSSSETHFLQGCRGHPCSTFIADDWPWDSTEFDREWPEERRGERRSGYIFSRVRIRSQNRDHRQAWRVDLPH